MHAIVLILLTGISIYSVYSVLNTFLFDNTVTTTSVKSSKNILPFAKYFTFNYEFGAEMIFPEMWKLNQSELVKFFPSSDTEPDVWLWASRIGHRINETVFSPKGVPIFGESLSLENLINIAALNYVINI